MELTSAVMRDSSHWASRPSSTENSSRCDDIRLRNGRPRLRAGRRVRYTRVIDARQQRHERLFDARKVAQRQVAVVKLALFEPLANDPLDQLLDRLTRVIAGGARGGLGAV